MADDKIYGDQLSYAPVGATDGGRMGRIRKTELKKITDAGGDASWDKTERSTKVTDSLGRRRFHGAFTGGFSAGYFNSVGSKEGWTPSTFRSSRSQRAQHTQSIDDFMDEEDKEEAASGRALTTTAQFSSFAGEGPTVNISSTASSSMSGWGGGAEPLGWRLLKTMGWKEGDALGAKLPPARKREMKAAAAAAPAAAPAQAGKKVYGAMLPPGGLDAFHRKMQDVLQSKPGAAAATTQTWVPSEASKLVAAPLKKDFYGLGYDPHHNAPEFASAAAAAALAKELQQEQENAERRTSHNRLTFGDDDEFDGVYGKEDMTQYDRELGGPAQRKQSQKPATVRSSDGPGGSLGWLDRNFVQATHIPEVPRWWAAPSVPADFEPFHHFDDADTGAAAARQAAVRQYQASSGGLLTHEGRAALLSEKPETEHREVGAGPSAAQEEMLQAAAKKIADQGKGAYNPYPKDDSKAKRYAAFVGSLAGSLEPGAAHTVDEEEREEFCRVIMMFQPRTSALNNKFTSCDDDAPDNDARRDRGKTPMELAAEKGLYGAATRTVHEWHPAPLLCKRTNQKNPFPGSDTIGTQKVETPAGFGHLPQHMLDSLAEELKPKEKPRKKKMQLEFDKGAEEEQVDETPIEKPSMDIFKAIFEDSDSDSEEEATPAQVAATSGEGALGEDQPPEAAAAEAAPPQGLDAPEDSNLAMAVDEAAGAPIPPPAPALAPPAEEPKEEKIVFRKPTAKRRMKNRPTAKDFMKTGL